MEPGRRDIGTPLSGVPVTGEDHAPATMTTPVHDGKPTTVRQSYGCPGGRTSDSGKLNAMYARVVVAAQRDDRVLLSVGHVSHGRAALQRGHPGRPEVISDRRRSTFDVLRSTFYVLRSTFYVLRSAFYVLRSAFYVRRPIGRRAGRFGGGLLLEAQINMPEGRCCSADGHPVQLSSAKRSHKENRIPEIELASDSCGFPFARRGHNTRTSREGGSDGTDGSGFAVGRPTVICRSAQVRVVDDDWLWTERQTPGSDGVFSSVRSA